jgi:hypothetical protein
VVDAEDQEGEGGGSKMSQVCFDVEVTQDGFDPDPPGNGGGRDRLILYGSAALIGIGVISQMGDD